MFPPSRCTKIFKITLNTPTLGRVRTFDIQSSLGNVLLGELSRLSAKKVLLTFCELSCIIEISRVISMLTNMLPGGTNWTFKFQIQKETLSFCLYLKSNSGYIELDSASCVFANIFPTCVFCICVTNTLCCCEVERVCIELDIGNVSGVRRRFLWLHCIKCTDALSALHKLPQIHQTQQMYS